MASKQDILDIKKILQDLRKSNFDLQLKVEELEDRVTALEGGERTAAKPKEPEPILTCVQCSDEYKESQNADGSCFYHSGSLAGHGWEFKYSCCNRGTRDYESAKTITGCVKGKHRSKHHTDYHYSKYVFYMQDQSNKAKELWLQVDIEDLVTNYCEWAEVGLNSNNDLFIVAGPSRVKFSAIAVYTSQELQQMEGNTVSAFNVSDPVGWNLSAEIIVKDGKATAVRVSIKPASSGTAVVKQVNLSYNEGVLVCGDITIISDPFAESKGKTQYNVPDEIKEGPSIDAGEDYSVNRKNDYEAEITGNCPLKLQQHGQTEVASSTRLIDGKWNNLFTCTAKVTNTIQENLSISDAVGHYLNKDGVWTKCDEVFIGKESYRGRYDWFDTTNFWLPEGTTGTLQVRLCIKFEGNPPASNYDGRRAHPSLPQPLHLKFTFIDANNNTASLQFEQGNKPLDIATKDKRIEGWCKKNKDKLLYWNFADDTDAMKRSDVTLYYNEEGLICYRPALNDNASNTYYVDTELRSIGYQGKVKGEKEFLIEKWKKEGKNCSIMPYGLVDLDTGIMYGMKIVVTTPTSTTTGYYLIPSTNVQGELTVVPEKAIVKSEVKVKWQVSRACTNDSIYIYPARGKSSVTRVSIKDLTEGEMTFKAPSVPGEYEARYYPASLQGQYHGYRHNLYIAPVRFTVVGAV